MLSALAAERARVMVWQWCGNGCVANNVGLALALATKRAHRTHETINHLIAPARLKTYLVLLLLLLRTGQTYTPPLPIRLLCYGRARHTHSNTHENV